MAASGSVIDPKVVEGLVTARWPKNSELGLCEEPDVNRRVKAVLLYLHEGRGR